MGKYRKLPVIIDAVQITDSTFDAPHPNPEHVIGIEYDPVLKCAWAETLEGTMRGNLGDWLITGVKGEHYFCKPDIFAATYEKVPSLDQNEDGSTICKVCGEDFNPFRYCPNDHRPYKKNI